MLSAFKLAHHFFRRCFSAALCIFMFLAIPVYTQETQELSYNFRDVSLRQVLEQISKKENVDFIFNDALIEGKLVNAEVFADSLGGILKELLSPENLAYKVQSSGKIVLYRAEQNMLHGYVLDGDDGGVLPYANIVLKGTNFGTSSNTEGYFALASPTADCCTLAVSYIGYKTGEVVADVPYGSSMKIKMQPTVLNSPEINISAARQPKLKSTGVFGEFELEPSELDMLPTVGGNDVNRSLQYFPGVGIFDQGLSIRGGTTGQNLVLWDGIPVYHSNFFLGFFSAFNPETVGEVKLYSGVAPVRYGHHTAGVLEITGRNPDFIKFKMRGRLSTLAAQVWASVPLSRRAALSFSVRRSMLNVKNNSLIQKIYEYRTGSPRNIVRWSTPDYHFSDMTSRLAVKLSESDSLSASLFWGIDESDKSYKLDYKNKTVVDENSWKNFGAGLSWFHRFSFRYRALTNIYLSRYKNYYKSNVLWFELPSQHGEPESTSINLTNNVQDIGIRSTHYLKTTNRFFKQLVWGGNISYKDVSDSLLIVSPENEKWENDLSVEGFIQGKIQAGRLTVFPGLRISQRFYGKSESRNVLNPRFNGQVQLKKRWLVKGSVGIYDQFLTGFDTQSYIVQSYATQIYIGNYLTWLPAHICVLQKSIGLSFDAEQTKLDVCLYDFEPGENVYIPAGNFFSNPIGWRQHKLGNNRLINRGVELLFQQHYKQFTGWFRYTFSKSEQGLLSGSGQFKAIPANHDLTHQAKVVVACSAQDWDVSGSWTFVSGRPFGYLSRDSNVPPESENYERLPSVHHLDMSIARKFYTRTLDWEIGCNLYNVYNRKNILSRHVDTDSNSSHFRSVDVFIPSFNPNLYIKIKMN